ncbi:hypothetical protein BKA63DRAFT_114103 [Paraphoma chrysanthemicola]|nr:hypothetical protein BKA63DRAFT_114103 [Paraphoma chrysanthemicola]
MRTVLIWAATAFVAITAQQVSTNGRCGIGFSNRVCRGSYGNCCSNTTIAVVHQGRILLQQACSRGNILNSPGLRSLLHQAHAVHLFPLRPLSTKSPRLDAVAIPTVLGSTSGYCGTGCQPGFGTCSGISSSVRSSSSTSLKPSSTTSSSTRTSSASSSTSPVASSTQVSLSAATSSAATSSYLSTTSSASFSPPSSASSTISSEASTTTPSPTPIDPIPSSPSSTPLPSPTPPAPPLQLVTNPSFELGTGPDPTSWTIERLYIIDAAASGRFASNPRTGTYAIRGRGQLGGGYDVTLSQTMTVVPGSSYNIEVFAKQTTAGFCSVSIYLGDRAVREFAPPGTTYTSISAAVDIGVQEAVQQVLLVDGACSLPSGGSAAEMYDLFIDDVSMTVVV